jgi:16S rRNA (guanine527-N7)-methyltransferase
MIENVVLDSLLFLKVLPTSFRSLLDIGSGAGIPGISIKIARPGIDLTMVESRGKRASFLSSAIRSLGLTGARVVRARAESMVEGGARFDAVVARCAGEAEAILDLGARLVSKPGVVILTGARDATPTWSSRRVSVMSPVTGGLRSFLVRDVT